MDKFLLIAGGGTFGIKAINFAKKQKYKTILVDKNSNCPAIKFINRRFYNSEQLEIIFNLIKPGEILFLQSEISVVFDLIHKIDFEYIVPVVPVHLLSLIIKSYFNELSISLTQHLSLTEYFVSNSNPELLLNYSIKNGVCYLSYAKIDEICPDNCSGPLDFCPNFKREKLITITNYLRNFYHTNEIIEILREEHIKIIIIVNSYQLISGLGGIKGEEIKRIFNILKEKREEYFNHEIDITIATTCNCHGVINFYKNY